MSLLVFLSVGGIGMCCSATSCGSAGGGSDWVPVMGVLVSDIFGSECRSGNGSGMVRILQVPIAGVDVLIFG